MNHIASLFPQYEKKKPASERGELIRYFHERVRDRKGKQYRAGYIAMRLAHLSVADLYAFRSMALDRERTQPGFVFSKFFWGSLKPRELSTPGGIGLEHT